MLHDEKFEGPDKKIIAELARHREPPPEDMVTLQGLLNRSDERPPDPYRQARPASNSARQVLEEYANAYGLRSDTQNTSSTTMKPQQRMINDLILFLIYRVKEKMAEMRPILDKYEFDERVRFGHIFCKLDKWKTELITIFVRIWRLKNRSLYSHLVLYTHLLAKNIDITYTVEFLLHLQQEYRGQVADMLKEYELSLRQMKQASMYKKYEDLKAKGWVS